MNLGKELTMSNDTQKPEDKKEDGKATDKGSHGGCGCGHQH
jgi:hypothetical protein